MKRKYLGSALVDYIVPTALVGVVAGLGVYGLFASGNLTKFFAASGNISVENGVATINKFDNTGSPLINNDSTTLTKPIKGGTSDTISCSSGSCDIDLGDFVLTGIPEDFNNFMESTASSGGTETLADLLEILAQSPELTKDQSDLIERLANAGHDIAADERSLEDEVLVMVETSLPIGFADEIPIDLISTSSESYQTFSSLLTQLSTMKASASTPELKKIFNTVNVLTDEISDIRRDVYNKTLGVKDLVASDDYSSVNLNTEMMGIASGYSADRTDIDSTIVCVTGAGLDDGSQCK